MSQKGQKYVIFTNFKFVIDNLKKVIYVAEKNIFAGKV